MVKRNRKTRRNKIICALRRIGISYKNIAKYNGLSIIRVRQIIEAGEAAGDTQTEGKEIEEKMSAAYE